MDKRPDPNEIIEKYHHKETAKPRLCKECGKGEMKKVGVRTSASVNYMVWKCSKCDKEELEFTGLDEAATKLV